MTDRPDYELEIHIRGPERTTETSYGTHTNRDELARLCLPLTPATAWEIFGMVGSRATSEDAAWTAGQCEGDGSGRARVFPARGGA